MAMSDQENKPMASEQTGNPLQFLEYLALAGTVVGTAAVAVGKNVAFAAAPMSLSLLLNLANRRRAEQVSLQNSQATLNQIQQVSHQIRALQDRPEPSAPLPAIESYDSGLTQRLESNLADMGGSMQQLQDRLAALELMQPAPGEAVQTLGGDPFGDPFADSAASAPMDPAFVRAEIKTQLEPFDQRLEALVAYFEQGLSAPASPATEADTNAVEMLKLQMQVQYTDLEASMNHVLEQLQQLPAATKLEQWAGTLAELSDTVEHAQNRMAALETSGASATPNDASSNSGLGELEPQLRQLMEQVEAQLSQLGAKVEQVEAALPSAAAAQSKQFEQYQQGQLVELQQQLQGLELKVDMSLSDLKADLQQVPELIAESLQEAQPQGGDALQPLHPSVASGVSANGNVAAEDLQSLDALLQELS
jgi:hypothetical protein